MTQLIAQFLAVYFTLVAAFYSLRLNMTRSQKVFNDQRFSVEWFGQWTFKVFQFVIWGICVARVFDRRVDSWLLVFDSLMVPAVAIVGLAALLAGTVGVLVSHFTLGASWRSGICTHATLRLVKTGVYHYSRNPIFLSVILCQVGFFLLLPSVFSLVCLLMGSFFIVRQVFVEERFLSDKFGAAYKRYKNKTPRWLVKV